MKLTITTSELQALKQSYFWGWVKALPNERYAVERLRAMGLVATRHDKGLGLVEFAITPLGRDVLEGLEEADPGPGGATAQSPGQPPRTARRGFSGERE